MFRGGRKRQHRAGTWAGAILDEAVPRELSRRLHIPGTTHARRSLAAAVSGSQPSRLEPVVASAGGRTPPVISGRHRHAGPARHRGTTSFDTGAAHTRTAAARTIPLRRRSRMREPSQAVRRCGTRSCGSCNPRRTPRAGRATRRAQFGTSGTYGPVWHRTRRRVEHNRAASSRVHRALQNRRPTYSLLSAAASGIGVSIPLGPEDASSRHRGGRRSSPATRWPQARRAWSPNRQAETGLLVNAFAEDTYEVSAAASEPARQQRPTPPTATSRAAAHSVVDLLVGERVALAPMPAFAIQMSVCRTPSRRPLGRRPRGLGRPVRRDRPLAVQAAAGAGTPPGPRHNGAARVPLRTANGRFRASP